MTEYKTFDDYVRNIFKIEPTELTHISPEEQKKKTVEITADELINIWNELTELKVENEQIKNSDTLCKLIGEQKRKITELEAQIEKMKCCQNCRKFNNLSYDCTCAEVCNGNEWELRR